MRGEGRGQTRKLKKIRGKKEDTFKVGEGGQKGKKNEIRDKKGEKF